MSFDINVLVKILTTKSAKQSNHLPCFVHLCDLLVVFASCFCCFCTFSSQSCSPSYSLVSECHQFILADLTFSLALFLILETE